MSGAPDSLHSPPSSRGARPGGLLAFLRGWMWTKARADGRAPAEGVCGGAVRGGGGGAGRTDNAGRGRAGGRAALCVLSLLSPCLSLAPLSFSFSSSPPLRFEGRGIHFNTTQWLLLIKLRRTVVLRAAAASVLAQPSSAGHRGFKCLFPFAPPLSRNSSGGGSGVDPSPVGPLPLRKPLIKGHEPRKERLALPFSVGPRRCPRAPAA